MKRRSRVPIVLYVAWLVVSLPVLAAGWVGVGLWVACGLAALPLVQRYRMTREEREAQRQALEQRAKEARQRLAAGRAGRRPQDPAARAEAVAQRRAKREAAVAASKAAAAARAEVESRTLRATYMGGLAALPHTGPAAVIRARDGGSVTIHLASGAQATIPTASILEVSLAQSSRVTSRGSSGAGGAVLGDIVAGPVGALVGGMATRRQQVATEDDSAVTVRVQTAPGRETTVVFKGPMGGGALAIYGKAAAVLAPAAEGTAER